MKTQSNMQNEIFYPHVSVDCVLMGAIDDKLSVLLVERQVAGSDEKHYKLPGSLIYESEDLDMAALRVLYEATGLKRLSLKQFKSFGSPKRTKNKEDVQWLENASKLKINRIITVAYLALCKMKKTELKDKGDTLIWAPVDELPHLPFDHREIVDSAVEEIRNWIDAEPRIVFDYLPAKFTAYQLRRTFEIIYNKPMDVRNFHKRMSAMEYVVLTDEREKGVSHRAARYYRFDKVKYNKLHSRFNKL